jgi:hypothetical protein
MKTNSADGHSRPTDDDDPTSMMDTSFAIAKEATALRRCRFLILVESQSEEKPERNERSCSVNGCFKIEGSRG